MTVETLLQNRGLDCSDPDFDYIFYMEIVEDTDPYSTFINTLCKKLEGKLFDGAYVQALVNVSDFLDKNYELLKSFSTKYWKEIEDITNKEWLKREWFFELMKFIEGHATMKVYTLFNTEVLDRI